MFKNINWEKVKASAIKSFFVFILNTALWVFLIGSFVPYGKIGEFRLSWIDYLRLSDKVEFYHIWLLYIGIGIGIILSFLFIKWWIDAARRERDKQDIIKSNEDAAQKIIEAMNVKQKIKEEKEQAKKDKIVRKYLGD